MNRVVLCLGGNQGDRGDFIIRAINSIALMIGEVDLRSSNYETEPWGFESDTPFLNCVVVCKTELSPEEVLQQIFKIEDSLQRVRVEGKRYSSRSMDIDILAYNDSVIDSPTLIVPHPRLQDRNFVLTPFAEVMPNWIHPTLNRSIIELKSICLDCLEVFKVEET